MHPAKRRPARKSGKTDGKTKAWIPLIPCALALCAYLPSLASGFIFDDQLQIVKNPQVQSWDYLPRLLTTNLWSQPGIVQNVSFYRPLFSLWMLLVNTVGGLSPWFWHLSSILLHVAATYLVFRLVKELLHHEFAAGFAALLFAVHPVHVDAVSWVSASNEILFTIFGLGSMLLLLAGAKSGFTNPSRVAGSVLLFAAALFSKETAIGLLPVLAVIAFASGDKPWPERLKGTLKLGPWYLLATIFYFGVRWLVLQRMGVETGTHTWRQVLYSAPSIIVFYCKKLIFPLHLSGFYVNQLISTTTMGMWLTLALILAGVALLIWLAVRYSPAVGIGGALLFFPLLPLLAGVRVFQQGDMTHDRYLYLPSIGLCLLVGLIVKRLWAERQFLQPALLTLGLLWAGLFAWLTIAQQRYYKDDEAFYQRGIEVDPSNVLVIDDLGITYLNDGQSDKSLEQFRNAYRIAPDDPNVKFHLARGLFETHQYAAAEPLFEELSRSPQPDSTRMKKILLTLADVEISLAKLPEATQTLQRLNLLDSVFPGLHRTLGIVFQEQGQIPEAQAEYAREYEASGDLEAKRQAMALGNFMLSSGQVNQLSKAGGQTVGRDRGPQ
jgi:protein O-mannosyl-transferase